MGMPEIGLTTPPLENYRKGDEGSKNDGIMTSKPDNPQRGTKRRPCEDPATFGKSNKTRRVEPLSATEAQRRGDLEDAIHECADANKPCGNDDVPYSPSLLYRGCHGVQRVNIRNMIKLLVNESLKAGGRIEHPPQQETKLGQVVDVETKVTDGSTRMKTVEWSVGATVPAFILGKVMPSFADLY